MLSLEDKVGRIKAYVPPLKWAGGKRWLVPRLRELWQGGDFDRLVEPFCGGLAIALGLNPKKALLNDINPHVINFYTQLQEGFIIDEPFANERGYYFSARDRFNHLIETSQAFSPGGAQWFYYLNRTGFNGLCRFNQKGFFNVPFGQYRTIHYLQDFTHYQNQLLPWQFTSNDFTALECRQQDFLYADPPYDVEFVSYAQSGFTWADQERLAFWLSKQPCPVVASNQATPRILELYGDLGFDIQILDAPRRIACTGDRTPAKEMLALK